MKFSTTAVLATAALGSATMSASAQGVASPAALLQYISSLLSPGCKATLESLLSPNSTSGTCLNIQGLFPILSNNDSSIIPQINDYLTTVCATPACTNATILNVTTSVASACSTELSYFGIDNSTLSIITNAYPTAREVACLTTSKSMNSTSSMNSTTSMNSTSSTNSTNSTNSTLCPTSLLYSLQSFLGVPLTNNYIDSLLLGANATAFNQVVSIVSNTTVLKKFACTDCVVGAVDVVLKNYPTLANETFRLPASNGTASNTSYTIETLLQGTCNVTVGPNATLPMGIKESAFGSNSTSFNMSSPAGINMTARSNIAKSRFRSWD